MEINERILQIRDYFCDGNNRNFANKIGLNEQYTSNICNGIRKASQKNLIKILDAFPQVNKSWLYFGDGDMLNATNTGDISNNHAGGDILGNGAVKTTPPEHGGNCAELVTIINRLTETNKQQTEQISALIELLKKQ